MAITKQKGDIAEAYLAYALKQKGFNVLMPWGEDVRYDLVSEKNGIFKRIQVKYVTPKNGILEVRFRSSNNHKVIHYSSSDVDIIAVYNEEGKKIYFIPLTDAGRKGYKLRLTPAKNNQKKFVTLSSKYESRFDFLEK